MNWHSILDPGGAFPLLASLTALALSLAALFAAWLGRISGWRQVEEEFSSRILFFESAAAARQAIPATQSTPPVPAGKPVAVLSPLETMQGEEVGDIVSVREQLSQIVRAAGSPKDLFGPAFEGFEDAVRRIRAAESEGQVQALRAKVLAALPALMPDVLSRCDLDLNPDQSNPAVEGSLRKMLAYAELEPISPARGAAFDAALHTRMGVVVGTVEQRGTVGQVRCRGLRDHDGNVLMKAEILEYD